VLRVVVVDGPALRLGRRERAPGGGKGEHGRLVRARAAVDFVVDRFAFGAGGRPSVAERQAIAAARPIGRAAAAAACPFLRARRRWLRQRLGSERSERGELGVAPLGG